MSFGRNFKEAIKSRGFDLDEAAIQVDLSYESLYGYSQGLHYPAFEKLIELCTKYKLSLNELCDGMYNKSVTEIPHADSILALLDSLVEKESVLACDILDITIKYLAHNELSSFGKRIRFLRNQNRMTVKQLHDITAISESSIRNMESDNAYPSVERLLVLAAYFRCSPDYLLSDFLPHLPARKLYSLSPDEIKMLHFQLERYFT